MTKFMLVALLVLCALFAVQESNGEKLDMALSGDLFGAPIRALEHIRNKRNTHRITIKRTSKSRIHKSTSHRATLSRTGYATGGARRQGGYSGEDDD